MTIRFPDGTSIQYNDAHYAVRGASGYTDLYTKEDGSWIAQVPTAGCVIEVRPACRIYNALHTTEQLRALLENARHMSYSDSRVLVELKKALQKFNSKTRSWKS